MNDSQYPLGLRIQGGGGFIKQQNLWFSNESSRNGDTLLLTSGELGATFSHLELERY